MRKTAIRVVLLLVIVAPATIMLLWWADHYRGDARTHKVSAGDLLSGVTVSGTIRCKRRVELASEVIAAVKTLEADEGDHVTKGQVLVRLDDSVLAAECATAAAQVELARLRLAELLAGARKQEIAKATQAVNRTEADLAYASDENDRLVAARRAHVASESEASLAANRLAKAKAELASAKAELDLLAAGPRLERVNRARGEVTLAAADLKRYEALRKKYTLLAPHDGTVTVRYASVGQTVSPGQVLLHVEDTDAIEVRAQVQESQLAGVKQGTRARVLVDAYPDKPLKAVVERILPRVDPEQGTVAVLLKLTESPEVALFDRMAADIAIIDAEVKDVLRVPAAAVDRRDGQCAVWVRQDGKFVRRDVKAGITGGHWVEIESGLDLGDVIRLP